MSRQTGPSSPFAGLRTRALVLTALALVPVFAAPVSAAIRRVPIDHATVRAAVDAAAGGDTILIAPGTHAGGVYISPHTGMLHFLTTFQGALRLVTLTRFRRGDDKLRGAILTQRDRDDFFQPAVSAIYLEKLSGKHKNSELEKLVGAFGRTDPAFRVASEELGAIERTALFASARSPPGA